MPYIGIWLQVHQLEFQRTLELYKKSLIVTLWQDINKQAQVVLKV